MLKLKFVNSETNTMLIDMGYFGEDTGLVDERGTKIHTGDRLRIVGGSDDICHIVGRNPEGFYAVMGYWSQTLGDVLASNIAIVEKRDSDVGAGHEWSWDYSPNRKIKVYEEKSFVLTNGMRTYGVVGTGTRFVLGGREVCVGDILINRNDHTGLVVEVPETGGYSIHGWMTTCLEDLVVEYGFRLADSHENRHAYERGLRLQVREKIVPRKEAIKPDVEAMRDLVISLRADIASAEEVIKQRKVQLDDVEKQLRERGLMVL